ncbi:hypothetical protein CYG48_21570 (plasmid) [Neorhizobium sp. SOG26]|uniref:cyclodeaminase/cyclohydrolase family protein n=1 Tax=Neorhizobium sp. SOG26 TaxID=2060726 RepID=UPI000E8B0A45|nr:cyclodeaminase/cyclohydrolase family protein [Neorhizobium sp. SOG26]AXV18327.1 hypothetical protein CYG48_21570 [Neorhizobium sp. SOG26]
MGQQQGLTDMSIAEINDAVGCKAPRLGGSTASLACALIGLGMAEMAVVISAARDKQDSALSHAEQEIGHLTQRLADAAEQDRIQFQRYMSILRQKSEEDHKPDKPLEDAGADATRQPLEAADVLMDCLELLAGVAGHIHHVVASDLFSGAGIVKAAFAGTMMAADVNLAEDRLSDLKQKTEAQRRDLDQRCRSAYAKLSQAALKHGFRM